MNVAIMGHGVVGSGVAEILIHNKSLIDERIKNDINVKYILDLREFNGYLTAINSQRISTIF